jgi:hypothetical protein
MVMWLAVGACCCHAVSGERRGEVADLMRRHGVRRVNAEKNIGLAKYAFNSMQKYFLPKELRPPKGTGGGGVN